MRPLILHPSSFVALLIALLTCLQPRDADALLIQFDYSFDSANFFPQGIRRDVLNQAASAFSAFTDELAAINPTATNTWTATFKAPGTGLAATKNNLQVPANTMIVYVGARDLGTTPTETTLADSSFGGAVVTSPGQAWKDTVLNRGQEVGPKEDQDFGPWGGDIAFNTNKAISWHFGLGNPPDNQMDALTIAIHELAHVLGFGVADSWDRYVDSAAQVFNGVWADAEAYPRPSVPLAPDLGHWQEGLGNHLMEPVTPLGKRIALSDLDIGGLCDVGWTHQTCRVPEPNSLLLIISALLAVGWVRRFVQASSSTL